MKIISQQQRPVLQEMKTQIIVDFGKNMNEKI